MNSELTNNGQPKVGLYLIGEAWELTKQQFGVWIPVFLIMGVINAGLQKILMPTPSIMPTPIQPGMPVPMPVSPLALYNPGHLLLFQLVSVLISTFFVAGMYKLAIKQVRGEPIGIGDAFSAGNVYFSVLVVLILRGILIGIGCALCIVPGLIVVGGLCLALPLVVDKAMSPIDALQLSWQTLKGKALSVFGVLFVSALAAALGLIGCCVGIIATAPIPLLTIALIYRNYFLQDAAPYISAPTGYEPPIPAPQ